MADQFPTYETVRKRLLSLSYADMEALEKASKVSFHTLLKIRNGTTENPGIETVHKFWSHIDAIEVQREKVKG